MSEFVSEEVSDLLPLLGLLPISCFGFIREWRVDPDFARIHFPKEHSLFCAPVTAVLFSVFIAHRSLIKRLPIPSIVCCVPLYILYIP